MKTQKLFLSLCSLVLLAGFPSCEDVKVQNTEACVVAGVLAAGMDCAETLSPKTRQMTLDESLDFLEPREEKRDSKGKLLSPAKGAAVCQSSDDFNKMKTALEQACYALGRACSYEIQEQIKKVTKTFEALQANATKKKRGDIMIKISTVPVKGSIGKDVLVLQKQLKAKGFEPGAIDGIFGSKTTLAISKLQKANKLPGSGVLGPKTLKLLNLTVVPVNPVTGDETITRDFAGKEDRHLHPSKRLEIENLIFPGGNIPACFIDEDPQACYVFVMRKIGERGWKEEGGDNRGSDIGEIQGTTGKFTKGGNGDAWCLDYCQMGVAIIEDYFRAESPVIGSAHCMTTVNAAKKIKGLVSLECEVGTIALSQHGKTSSGHAMAVIEKKPNGKMLTSEGNTSIANIRNGNGSGIKTRSQTQNGELIVRGFVRLYPNNLLPKLG